MQRMRCRRIVGAALVSALSWSAPAAASVSVVATIFPLADIVQQIGGADVQVVTLLPPGASPHTFEPTPAQMREIARAQVCVCVGAGLDNWTTSLLAAGGADIRVVTISDGLQQLGSTEMHGPPGQGLDPHVWLDPVLVRDHVVPMIADALAQVAADQRAAFATNAARFRDALSDLDTDIRHTLAPLSGTSYVAFHSAWRYFSRRYGLHEVAVVEPFPGKEPSAQEITAVVKAARAAHARALLVEPQFSARIAEQIAREFGGHTLLVDPIGAADLPGRNHYLDLMRYNLRAFAAGLQ
jgi:zinc transport system substrate-binding protein